MRRVSLAVALLGAIAGAACSAGSNPSSSDSGRGVPGSTFTVLVRGEQPVYNPDPLVATTVMLPLGGRVTGTGINCGIVGGVPSFDCSEDFPWGTTADPTSVALTATPDAGAAYAFYAFAGACSGTGTTAAPRACTVTGNSDKMVVIRFAQTQAGLGAHPNFSDPVVHGPEYAKWASNAAGALLCTNCHGANLQGAGIAPSCAACHPAPAIPGGAALTRNEQCAGCHGGQGAAHQAAYDRYSDASKLAVTVDGIATDPTGVSTMTFSVTMNGQPFVSAGLAALEQKRYYAVEYDPATGKFDRMIQYGTPAATATAGQYTVRATGVAYAPESANAVAYIYLADGPMTFEAFTVYDDVGHVGREFGTVDYVSAANDSGCQRCHGTPYMKHGYRAAAVPGLDEFAACKTCHYDTRNGGHQGWQLLVDDPLAYATQDGVLTTEQKTKYAYKATVMNDTHMSHAMEFAYPQSMANCVACHAGKLDMILSDAKFTLATCKSCHPVTGVGGTDPKRAPALTTLMNPAIHTMDLYTYTGPCNNCHQTGVIKPFSAIHTGYDKLIYAGTAGTKFSQAFTFSIDSASIDADNVLTFTATVTEGIDIAGMSVEDVAPAAYVAPYGFDTKDFIQGAKNTKLNAPGTGWTVTVTSTATTKTWTASLDLDTVGGTAWTDGIANGTINRLEIGIMPFLPNLDGYTYVPHGSTTPATAPVALNFVTRTFDLVGNAFAAPVAGIVDVNKCNKCHDALGTTFHTADRGGSVVGCRICHTTLSAGSHLEMQSRSIDSYVHAIHAMQPFDIGDVDWTDPVAAMHYDHHVESTYPNFSLLNCESCHNPGTYEAPSHASSLPGVLSGSDTLLPGRTRTIGTVGGVVTGPAARACGSCHRAYLINEDAAEDLASLDAHTAAFGYRDAGTSRSVFDSVIAKVQEYIDYLLP